MKQLAFTFTPQALEHLKYNQKAREAFTQEGVERLTTDTFAMSFPEEADYEQSAKEVNLFLNRLGYEENFDYAL